VGWQEVVSTWLQVEEEEGNKVISKSSALAQLMKYLNVGSLDLLYGKEVETIEQSKEDTYLCIKAY
jgi:hypothetical protein